MSRLALLVRKDFAAMWRDKGVMLAAPCFALTCVIVASFALRRVGYTESDLRAMTPGVLMLVFVFSSAAVLTHSFLGEWKSRAFEGILLAPIDPLVIYFSKFLVNMTLLACLLFLVVLSHAIFFGAQIMGLVPELFLSLVLAAVGFVAVGTLLASVASSGRAREFLLSVILFPLIIPFVYAAVNVARDVLEQGGINYGGFWFMFLLAISVLSVFVSALLFEFLARS